MAKSKQKIKILLNLENFTQETLIYKEVSIEWRLTRKRQ